MFQFYSDGNYTICLIPGMAVNSSLIRGKFNWCIKMMIGFTMKMYCQIVNLELARSD